MADEQLEFQKRARRVEDDGHDFETFVFECFRVAKEERGFTRRLARGRDGAIDLIDRFAELGAATVAECKFIGSGSADEAVARWRKVARNLANNLPALHADAATNPSSPYRNWLDPERPVTRYRFCVTASMSPLEVGNLERQIVTDFGELVRAGVEPLRALAENDDGAVRVLPWDWFDTELNTHPTLAFRWFRGLPIGVDLFEPELGGEATFRDFLRAGELRYFSRDEYEGQGIGRLERGEAELSAALAGAGMQALLITGPGGVGKTRLSWELAAELTKPKRAFDVYRLGRSAGFDSVVELATRYPADASILLLLDYAEAANELAGIADAVQHVTNNSGLGLRLIATCRASAGNQVRDALGVLTLEEKSLGSVRAGEPAYVTWVAQSILALEDLPSRERIGRVCRDVPALAAFAIFLHRRYPQQFDAQFGALHEVEDFEKWAAHRISALVEGSGSGPHQAERLLARLALSLPMSAERIETIAAEDSVNRTLIRTLLDDRWIEREERQIVAAHDVLADALAARWLFETDSAAADRALDLLQRAVDAGELERNLIALERLSPHPKFDEIDGGRLIAELLALLPDEAAASLPQVLSGLLLSTEEKLTLLHTHAPLQERAKADRLLDGPLGYLAEQSARRGFASNDVRVATLLDLLDHATLQTQTSNMTLRRAYTLDPARFRERAYISLDCFPTAEPTHFLLAQMLRSGEPLASLERAVCYWIVRNATAWRAQFLYKAWLDQGGSIEAVSAPLLAWVAEHGLTLEAEFVYKAWLDRGGSVDVVSEPILAWIARHGTAPQASHVYRGWLDRGGSIEAVSELMLAWIAAHGITPKARFVYIGWLKREGPFEALREQLFTWVAANGTMLEASGIYIAWLARREALEEVLEPLLAWIAAHGLTLDAHLVYTAWLDWGGAAEAVSEPLFAWLREHGTAPEASHVYKAWLDAGGGTAAVSEPLLAWVGEHGTTFEADHVYRSWLDADGEFAPIQDQAYRWALQWCGTLDFVYLGKALSKRVDLPELIILAIARWCAAYPVHEDCLYRLSSLVDHLRPGSLSAGGVTTLLRCVDMVVEAREGLSGLDRAQLWSLCVGLGRALVFNLDPHGATRSVAAIIASGEVFDRDLSAGPFKSLENTHEQITQLVLSGLRWGALSVDHDFDALLRFGEWLRASDADTVPAARLLERLNAEFPSKAWE